MRNKVVVLILFDSKTSYKGILLQQHVRWWKQRSMNEIQNQEIEPHICGQLIANGKRIIFSTYGADAFKQQYTKKQNKTKQNKT